MGHRLRAVGQTRSGRSRPSGASVSPMELVEGYGYPQLTDELKAKVLGTNAARLWGLETASNTPPAEPSRIVAA